MGIAVSRRGLFRIGVAGTLSFFAGCGMIMHPERRNQPTGGGIDWTVFALDTVGLLLFFFPGVIAFAVDFTTGAIYLPVTNYGDNKLPAEGKKLVEVRVPKEELTPERIQQVASQHVGHNVRLAIGEFVTSPLKKIDDFWTTREKLANEPA
jgi:hypothetical protein